MNQLLSGAVLATEVLTGLLVATIAALTRTRVPLGLGRTAQASSTDIRRMQETKDLANVPEVGTRSAANTPYWAEQNCSILLVDIAKFGGAHRTDADRLILRRIMYELLENSCRTSAIPWQACHREDRGDGALIIIPPGTPTRCAVDPLISSLTAGLRHHNRAVSEALRMQLRVALHVGPVTPDNEGVAGHAIIDTARLLDARVLKQGLARVPHTDLGFITSGFVYDTVVRHAPGGVDPATYRRVTIHVKDRSLSAWIHPRFQ